MCNTFAVLVRPLPRSLACARSFLSGGTLYVTRLRSQCDRCRVDWNMLFHFLGWCVVCITLAVLVFSGRALCPSCFRW